MKKLLLSSLFVCFSFMLTAMPSAFASEEQVLKAFNDIKAQLSKQLPMKAPNGTFMNEVNVLDGPTLEFVYTVEGLTKADFTDEKKGEMNEILKQSTCTNKSFINLLSAGGNFRATYKTPENELLHEITVSNKSCK